MNIYEHAIKNNSDIKNILKKIYDKFSKNTKKY